MKKDKTSGKALAAARWAAIERVLGDFELTHCDRMVGVAIIRRINADLGYAYPSVRHIADWLGVATRTVSRAIANLRDRYFHVVAIPGRSNRYHLMTDGSDTDVSCQADREIVLPEWWDAGVVPPLTSVSDKDGTKYGREEINALVATWCQQTDASSRLLKAADGRLSDCEAKALVARFANDVAGALFQKPKGPQLQVFFSRFEKYVVDVVSETGSIDTLLPPT